MAAPPLLLLQNLRLRFGITTLLDGASLAQFLVDRLIHHGHAAFAHLAHDAKAVRNQVARLERAGGFHARDERVVEKIAHALVLFQTVEKLALEPVVSRAGRADKRLPPVASTLAEGGAKQRHEALVPLAFAWHDDPSSRSKSHCRARIHRFWNWSRVR